MKNVPISYNVKILSSRGHSALTPKHTAEYMRAGEKIVINLRVKLVSYKILVFCVQLNRSSTRINLEGF